MTADVVEIYLPIMKNGMFHGAFEIYYDITGRNKMLTILLHRSMYSLSALAVIIFFSIILLLLNASKISIDNKRHAAALRESQEKYRDLVQGANSIILEFDTKGNITFFNDFAQQFFGYTEKEILGINLIGTILPEVESTGRDLRAMFLDIGKNPEKYLSNVNENMKKNGDRVWITWTNKAILDKDNNLTGVLSIGNDITERKILEEQLQQAKEEAEIANRAKSEFLANMSHEIRTPMNAIIGFADFLLDTDLDESQMEYSRTIKSSGDALLSVINDILDFSKIESGELDFEEIDFDPEILTYDVCELIRPRVGSKPIEIMCSIGDELPAYVKGDPGRYRQVLTNLMGNASKFTEAGEIELSLDVETENSDKIKLHARVRDTGIGLSKDKLEAIFKPFQQADGSTTRRYGGTGLGLSICKKISKLMAGDVWAESEVGKGSLFHFTAWLKKTDEKVSKRFVPVSLSGKKALIVDDNQRNLGILEKLLKSVNMEVVSLRNGGKVTATLEEAFKEQARFDIGIMDIQMPDMSGYDIAEQIRDLKSDICDLPLIALSSSTDRDAKKCKEAGFDGFLSKPIRREKLFQMLERILGKKEAEKAKAGIIKPQILTQYSVREEIKHSVRILLAEDNPVNQKLAKLMLTKAGYQVEVVNNGKEAVDKYTAAPGDFDLIFMDIQMPEMDGIAATRKIRNLSPKIRKIPIVAMTAHAMKGDREKYLDAGMDDYISKPIKREIVFDILRKWVF